MPGEMNPDTNFKVIRWTRYDGTAETLPFDGELVLLTRVNQRHFYPVRARFEHYDPISEWRINIENVDVQVGDLWAYLPVPPEDE